jgi:hypothetical protein
MRTASFRLKIIFYYTQAYGFNQFTRMLSLKYFSGGHTNLLNMQEVGATISWLDYFILPLGLTLYDYKKEEIAAYEVV